MHDERDKVMDKSMTTYELSEKELRELQMIQLDMLCEVDRICRKCNIHYNIIAGTLLGAVRHQGYIPWDDDADVALLRSEYERFREVCKTELDHDKFYFQDHTNTEGYRWGYGKLRRKETLFLREHQEDMPYDQGVFIDIFPLDNVSDSKFGRGWMNFQCFILRKAMWAPIGIKASDNMLKKISYRMLLKLPDSFVYGRYEKLVKRCKGINSGWVRILTFPAPNSEYAYLRKWYENSEEILFEQTAFWGIKDRDEYLKFKYGDYMQLPGAKDRKVHGVTAIKLVDTDNNA